MFLLIVTLYWIMMGDDFDTAVARSVIREPDTKGESEEKEDWSNRAIL